MSFQSRILLPSDAGLSHLLRKFRHGIVALCLVVPMMMVLGMYGQPRNGVSYSAWNNPANLSTAYGSLNNFDCVNDTGVEAHGFEIELDDIRSTDISYTYDYNHYGVPKITEDLSDPAHPKVFVRYASGKKPDGTWAAYTAIPSGPINPTDGHQFTDPSINFGGEHFGVGYNANPTAVKYNWLIDDGSGNLVHGPPVLVATPNFNYVPPIGGVAGNVVAVIALPPPPAPPVYAFGEACWVNAIKTTSHNPNKVRLQDLVSDDPGIEPPWANGEPDEVENEWKIMQTEFGAANGGANGELEGGQEDLPGGDEVITRRYEFFKYIGPIDAESGEAMADTVGPDGIHGVGTVTYNDHIDPLTGEWVTVTVDLSTIEVVGEFFGAQMSGFDVAPALGLIDNIQDGELNVSFPDRRVVIGGGFPFTASITSGNLPPGMDLGQWTGILTGIPTQTGAFTFTVEASDLSGMSVSHTYTLTVVSGVNEGTYNITTSSLPVAGGSTSGGGTYNIGDSATVVATANAGYYFDFWSEGDVHFSFTPSYTFNVGASRDLVANFLPDGVSPVTMAFTSGILGNNGWYRSQVEVSLSATDDKSGVDATYYQLDGAATVAYVGPFVVAGDGSHSLSYWSRDKAQNTEPPNSLAVDVDGTPPALTATASPNVLKPANGKMKSVTISGTISDLASGIETISGAFSTVDSYGLIQPAGNFTIAPNGSYSFSILLEARLNKKATIARTYTLTVSANDLAGNSGTRSVLVTVPSKK